VRDSISVAYQRKEEPIVLPSELQQLPERQGYLWLAGYDVARVAFPLLPAQVHQSSFVPRGQTTERDDGEVEDTATPAPTPANAAERPLMVISKPTTTADTEAERPLVVISKPPTTTADTEADTTEALPEEQAQLPLFPASPVRSVKRRM
jgi:hypothetical protein